MAARASVSDATAPPHSPYFSLASRYRAVWLTSVPRAHAAGVLQLGDPSLQLTGQKLPTGGSHYTYTCSAAQTNAWAVDEITVFSSILHMHKNGAQMYTEVTDPAGSVVKRTNSVEYFDFEHQDPTLLETFTIAKGSTLTTRCYFDNIVGPDLSFGLGSDQEMCIDFVYYYPVTPGLDKVRVCKTFVCFVI